MLVIHLTYTNALSSNIFDIAGDGTSGGLYAWLVQTQMLQGMNDLSSGSNERLGCHYRILDPEGVQSISQVSTSSHSI